MQNKIFTLVVSVLGFMILLNLYLTFVPKDYVVQPLIEYASCSSYNYEHGVTEHVCKPSRFHNWVKNRRENRYKMND